MIMTITKCLQQFEVTTDTTMCNFLFGGLVIEAILCE